MRVSHHQRRETQTGLSAMSPYLSVLAISFLSFFPLRFFFCVAQVTPSTLLNSATGKDSPSSGNRMLACVC